MEPSQDEVAAAVLSRRFKHIETTGQRTTINISIKVVAFGVLIGNVLTAAIVGVAWVVVMTALGRI